MRRLCWLAVMALSLLPAVAGAQGITYKPPAGTGSGDIDPAQLSSPDGSIAIGGVVGAVTLQCDGTVCFTYSTGASDPATCTQGAQLHYRTDTGEIKVCSGNAWKKLVDVSLTSTSGFGFVVDEDDMASDSATKVPTQQSVKAYVDANAGGSFDPTTTVTFYTDCMTGTTTAGTECGGLSHTLIASGTISQSAGNSSTGALRLLSSGSDNSGVLVGLTGAALPLASTYWYNNDWTIIVGFIPGANSTAITNTAWFIGLSAGIAAYETGAVSGIGVRHDSDLGDTAHVFLVCNASGAAGCGAAGDDTNQKVVASTITPSAGTGYKYKIRRAANGVGGNPTIYMSAAAYGDAFETEKTFCASGCDDTLGTIPSTTLILVVNYISQTTTANLAGDLDFLYVTGAISR